MESAAAGLAIRELAVPLIYLDEKRSFGGELDHAETRLKHYRQVIARSLNRHPVFAERSDLGNVTRDSNSRTP